MLPISKDDFDAWREELHAMGEIVQDDNPTVSREEAARRVRRYLELVRAVEGTEGPEVFDALVRSMRAEHDYGAYESTLGALEQFPADVFGLTVCRHFPG